MTDSARQPRTPAEWSRKAVTIDGWAWAAGMLTQHVERVVAVAKDGRLLVVDGQHGPSDPLDCDPRWVRPDDGGPRYPDLTDDPTVGALLRLARERMGEPLLHFRPWTEEAGFIERPVDHGEAHEWLRVDGTWGEGSAAPIEADEVGALVMVLQAAAARR